MLAYLLKYRTKSFWKNRLKCDFNGDNSGTYCGYNNEDELKQDSKSTVTDDI